MGQARLPVRKIREVLRLKAEGFSDRQIGVAIGSARSTVQECIKRAREAGVAWAMVENGYGVSAIRRSIDHHLGPAGTPLGASPAAAAKRS